MGVQDRDWSRKDGPETPPRQSGSGRVPQWAIEESLNEQLRAYQPERGVGGPTRTRGRRRRPRSSAYKLRIRTAALIVFVAALYLTPTVFERQILPDVLPYLPWSNVPPRGVGAADSPLGMPPPSTGSSQYELYSYPDLAQDFVAYDPCRPVHYVVRPAFAPAGSEGLIEEAVAEVAAATGLQFVYDGPTTEAPSEERDPYQPERYGKQWAPILITWTNPAEVPELEGAVAGLGGSEIAHRPGKPVVYVAGQARLDAPDLATALLFPGGRDLVRAVIIHELAHVLGLDHVDDPDQLMYERGMRSTLGDGDRAGLAVLGTGPCVPEL